MEVRNRRVQRAQATEERNQRHEAWKDCHEAWKVRHAAWLDRKAAWEARQVACVPSKNADQDDGRSESGASVSTAATVADGLPPRLSVLEEREARKLEGKLREIRVLEDRMAQGHSLDSLQRLKIAKRPELEGTLVMQKVLLGYQRRSDLSKRT